MPRLCALSLSQDVGAQLTEPPVASLDETFYVLTSATREGVRIISWLLRRVLYLLTCVESSGKADAIHDVAHAFNAGGQRGCLCALILA